MKKYLTAMFAVITVAFASAMPAQAQMFRQAMAENVYEQNIPNFRQMGLMPPTGMEINLNVVSDVAFEMATRDGSLATLPEEFRTADNYKTRFRIVNGLTDRTMPIEQFRALVSGRGIRLLRPTDFEAAPAAPITTTPVPASTAAPATVTPPAPVRVATPADTARIRGLEERVAAAETAARQGRITPAQLAELQALRAELNQAKTDIGALTSTATALDGRVTTVEGIARNAVTSEQMSTALNGKADESNVTSWVMGLIIGIVAVLGLLLAIATYGRLLRTNKRVTTLENDAVDGAEARFHIKIEDNMEEVLNALAEGEVRDIRVDYEGISGYLGFEKVGKGKVITAQILDQTQAMNIKTLRSTIKRHIGAGRVQLRPLPSPRVVADAEAA